MSQIILHHYPLSTFSEKVRLALGLKGLAYGSVDIAPMPPRPLLNALTGGYRKLFNHAWQPIVSVNVSLGREDTIAQGRQDLARQYAGGRLGVSFTPAAKWGVALGYSVQSSRYQAQDAFFGVARRDDYDAFDAAVTYLINRNLSLRAEALLSKNRANIELLSFRRDIFALKLRYEFK